MPLTNAKIAELRAAFAADEYGVRPTAVSVEVRVLIALFDEIEALRAALAECAAPWSSPPTTVTGAAHYLSAEFQRRMNLAAAALSQEESDPGVGPGMDGAHVGFARRALSEKDAAE